MLLQLCVVLILGSKRRVGVNAACGARCLAVWHPDELGGQRREQAAGAGAGASSVEIFSCPVHSLCCLRCSMPDWGKNKGGSRCSETWRYSPDGSAQPTEKGEQGELGRAPRRASVVPLAPPTELVSAADAPPVCHSRLRGRLQRWRPLTSSLLDCHSTSTPLTPARSALCFSGDCGVPLAEDTAGFQLGPVERAEDVPLSFTPELTCSWVLGKQVRAVCAELATACGWVRCRAAVGWQRQGPIAGMAHAAACT